MNKAIIESIEWHKDQLFKLLEDDNLIKIEGSIHSVKTDLNEIIEKAKSKKRVWVKPTATKKGHYREMEVGIKEDVVAPVKEKKREWSQDLEKKSEKAANDALAIAKETVSVSNKEMANAKSSGSAWDAMASAEQAAAASSNAEDVMNVASKYSELAYSAGKDDIGDRADFAASEAEDAMKHAMNIAAAASAIAAKKDPSYADEAKGYAEEAAN